MPHTIRSSSRARRWSAALLPVATLAFAASCNENLPSGPTNFSASVAIVVVHDTLVVGDSSKVQALAKDGTGRTIENLSFNWVSGDPTTVDFAAVATPDTTQGRARVLVAKKTGLSVVTLTLPDARFVASSATRTEVGVVAGVRVLSTHDSTLTAVNDTAFAIAAGLVHVNAASVTRTGTGLKWTHIGSHVTLVGTSDTVRYIAKTNGVDTLIASHDFCLAGAKCADTVFARVNQQLVLTLSTRSFAAYSFADSVGPTVTLADRRGNGLTGTTIRFSPATLADSFVVTVSGLIGTTNFTNGSMAVPKLIAAGNGVGKAYVLGIAPDAITVMAKDSVTVFVRQVARRVAAEPLRATMTSNDSIPVRAVARDARGAVIADAGASLTANLINLNGVWAGPTIVAAPTFASLQPNLANGVALPANNPGAPQIPVSSDVSTLQMLKPDTATAGTTSRTISVTILDSTAVPAVGRWVRFFANGGGLIPDSVQADVNGLVTVFWQPPDAAGFYTLTGVRGATTPLNTLADSTGRVVIRQSIVVKPDVPAANTSAVGISATTVGVTLTATVTIQVRDRFNNLVTNATPASFTLTATNGTISGTVCNLGICTATYTAPAAAGPDSIVAMIGGVAILFSPIALNII